MGHLQKVLHAMSVAIIRMGTLSWMNTLTFEKAPTPFLGHLVQWCCQGSMSHIVVPYTRVNKRNSLLGAYWLLSACFFPGFAPG